jgi:hypothetical protein
MALSYAKKETPLPILNKKTQILHHFHLPKKKPPHPILNKKTQVLRQFHLPKKKFHTQPSIKDTSITPIPFDKEKPHTQSSIKDTSITSIPFAKKKSHTQSSIKRHEYYVTSICQKNYTQLLI